MGNTESTLDPRGCCGIQPKNPVKGGGFNAESAAVNGNVANLAVPKVLEDFLEGFCCTSCTAVGVGQQRLQGRYEVMP